MKQLGDHSEALARLQPGTRVAIEGPYGAFTHHARHTDRVLLVGAGVGSTPVRAMLDDLPRHVDVVAILRASSERDLVLRDEIAMLVGERGGRLHEVVGPRSLASRWTRPRSAVSCPTSPSVTCIICGPRRFHATRSSTTPARSACRSDRIHHEDVRVLSDAPRRTIMKRSLIVIGATAAGLGLDPELPSPGTAEASQATAAALTTGNSHVAGAQTVVGTDQALAGNLGDIQVKVTAANGKIASVGMAQHEPARAAVAADLEQRHPAAPAADAGGNGGPIQGVSGATYTSQAYARSLQAALDKLAGGPNAQLAARGNGNGSLLQSHGGEHDD